MNDNLSPNASDDEREATKVCSYCIEGMYLDAEKNECHYCNKIDNECSECTRNSNKCTKCVKNTILENGRCIKCPNKH